jgi:flavin-dependent dehydrogenase
VSKKVLVIGGGPGGSTAATLLAQAGLQVELLERETFPRYHIGESLASSCRLLLELSGVVPKIDMQGYPVKRGGLLRWGGEDDWKIDWSDLFGNNVSAWQVERGEFDKILLDHASLQGVNVRQGAMVKRVLFTDDRPTAVEWVAKESLGEVRRSGYDFLVDASGSSGVLSSQCFKNRKTHEVFRNVAIWGYWQGGALLPDTPSGGINVVSHPDGWYWIIPLRDDRYSVGFVTHKDSFTARRREYASDAELLLALVNDSETVRELLAEGSFQSKVRIEQDYSYVADQFCGPGYYQIGRAHV